MHFRNKEISNKVPALVSIYKAVRGKILPDAQYDSEYRSATSSHYSRCLTPRNKAGIKLQKLEKNRAPSLRKMVLKKRNEIDCIMKKTINWIWN